MKIEVEDETSLIPSDSPMGTLMYNVLAEFDDCVTVTVITSTCCTHDVGTEFLNSDYCAETANVVQLRHHRRQSSRQSPGLQPLHHPIDRMRRGFVPDT